MLCGLVFLTTGAGWWGCQLQFAVHMTVQSVMSSAVPRTTGGSHPSVTLVSWVLWWAPSFNWNWHCCHAVLLWHPPLPGCLLAHFLRRVAYPCLKARKARCLRNTEGRAMQRKQGRKLGGSGFRKKKINSRDNYLCVIITLSPKQEK